MKLIKKIFRKKIKLSLYQILKHFRPGNIVMYHLGRCGSKIVGSMLSRTNNIYWSDALFGKILKDLYIHINGSIAKVNIDVHNDNYGNEKYWREILNGIGINELGNIDNQHKGQIMDLISNYMKNSGYHYFGFDIKPFNNRVLNYNMSNFIHDIENKGFNYFIILDRKNRLRKILSSIIAHQYTNKWHNTKEDQTKLIKLKVNLNRVEIDLDSKPLVKYLEDYEKQFNELNQLLDNKKNLLKLYYEDDIQIDPQLAYIKICTFLGVSPMKLDIPLKKTNPYQIESMVTNFSELEVYLKNSPYEWMLYD